LLGDAVTTLCFIVGASAFQVKKGLRQGDPTLLVLAMEYLNRSLIEKKTNFNFHPDKILHVCFGPLDVEVMLSLCSYSMMLSVTFLLSPGLILTTLYSADAD